MPDRPHVKIKDIQPGVAIAGVYGLQNPQVGNTRMGKPFFKTILRDATGESAHVGVRVGGECLVLDRVIGTQPYKCYVEAGTMGPLHAAAPGKAMLAWLPERTLDELLVGYDFRPLTPATVTSRRVNAAGRSISARRSRGTTASRRRSSMPTTCRSRPCGSPRSPRASPRATAAASPRP